MKLFTLPFLAKRWQYRAWFDFYTARLEPSKFHAFTFKNLVQMREPMVLFYFLEAERFISFFSSVGGWWRDLHWLQEPGERLGGAAEERRGQPCLGAALLYETEGVNRAAAAAGRDGEEEKRTRADWARTANSWREWEAGQSATQVRQHNRGECSRGWISCLTCFCTVYTYLPHHMVSWEG